MGTLTQNLESYGFFLKLGMGPRVCVPPCPLIVPANIDQKWPKTAKKWPKKANFGLQISGPNKLQILHLRPFL